MEDEKKRQIITTLTAGLRDYLNEKQLAFILPYFLNYPMRLKIVHIKKSYWGLCRYPRNKGDRYLITLVRTDIPGHFFLVFLHEIAHMLAHLEYGKEISSSHGKEWGTIAQNLVVKSAREGCFPDNELAVIARYVNRPVPLTNARMNEMQQKIMQLYKPETLMVSALPPDAVFTLKNGMKMKFVRKLRKYFECVEVHTGGRYRVNPDAEVVSWEKGSNKN